MSAGNAILGAGFTGLGAASSVLPRPRWSVMIPTYNCASLLREALASVLAQSYPPDQMEIEVIDDASTDDPASVVQGFGCSQIKYQRHPDNLGAISTFNACAARSRGHLVHVLHADDYVLPGFYSTIDELADSHPEAALLATRTFHVDAAGEVTGVTPLLPGLGAPSRDLGAFARGTPLQFAGVVLRRSFYEAEGGFRTELVHTADFEMWMRAISRGGGVVSPKVLACYRVFAGNDTSRLRRSGENVRDYVRCAHIMAGTWTQGQIDASIERAVDMALHQAVQFRNAGDHEAEAANLAAYRDVATPRRVARRFARRIRDALLEAWWRLPCA